MRIKFHRIVAALLLITMLCTLFPASVLAAEDTAAEPTEQEEIVTETDPAPPASEDVETSEATEESVPAETGPAEAWTEPDDVTPEETVEVESEPADVELPESSEPDATEPEVSAAPEPVEEEAAEHEAPVAEVPEEELAERSAARGVGDSYTMVWYDMIAPNTGNYFSVGTSYIRELHIKAIKKNGTLVPAYCIDPNRDASEADDGYRESGTGESSQDEAWKDLTYAQQTAITLVLAYSKMYRTSSGMDSYEDTAVQVLVWEIVTGQRKAIPPYGTASGGNTPIYSNAIGAAPKLWSTANYNKCRNLYDKIVAAMARHNTIPSFTGANNKKAKTHEMKFDGSKYTVTLEDDNKVLADYNWSAPGITFTKNGNKLTVSASSAEAIDNVLCRSDEAHKLTEGYGVVVYSAKKQGMQTIVCSANNQQPDPVRAYMRFRAGGDGSMTIKKTSDTGDVEGYCFKLYAWGTNESFYGVSDANGTVHVADENYNGSAATEFHGLRDGEFTFVEALSRHGAESNVEPRFITFTVKNKAGEVVYEKTYRKFKHLDNGDISINKFNLEGLSDEGVLEVEVHNAPVAGFASITKTTSEGPKEGFQFMLTGPDRTVYAMSGENGKAYETDEEFNPLETNVYKFDGMRDGKYTLTEVDPGEYVPGAIKVSVKKGDDTTVLAEYGVNDIAYADGNFTTPEFTATGLNDGGTLIITIKNVKPTISTAASNKETGGKELPYKASAVTADAVSITDAIVGHQYHLVTYFMSPDSGYPLYDENGDLINAVSDSFPCTAESMTVDTELAIDTSEFEEGDVVTICQELWDDTLGRRVATHKDADDENQQLTIGPAPSMRTTATWQDGSKVAFDFEAKQVLEHADLSDVPSGDYIMVTRLMNKQTREMVPGMRQVSDAFTLVYGTAGAFDTAFDLSELDEIPEEMVVFELLYKADDVDLETPFLVHEDWDDEGQTVKTATIEIRTLAQSGREGKFFVIGVDDRIDDKVFVKIEGNVDEAEYEFSCQLMEAIFNEDGSFTEKELILDGKPVFAYAKAVLGEGEHVVTVTFTDLDWEALAGKHLVCYEDVDRTADGVHIADHKDISDEGQSIWFPDAHTTASDVNTDSHYTYTVPEYNGCDLYNYEGLKAGETYELDMYVMLAKFGEDGSLLDEKAAEDEEGQPIVIHTSFTAEAESGVVPIYYTVPAMELEGWKTVVGEVLYYQGSIINVHYDAHDDEQTVTPKTPTLHTTATVNGQHVVYANGKIFMEDNMTGENWLTGKYHAIGRIMLKYMENGKQVVEPLLVDGEEVTAELYFEIETGEDGAPVMLDVTVEFPEFDGKLVAGCETVVYEDVYWIVENEEGEEIEVPLVSHHDADDENQTVTFKTLKFGTVATVNEQKSIQVGQFAKVEDEIKYEGAVVGKPITFHAILRERVVKNGKVELIPFLVNGKPIEGSVTVTPDSESGSVIVKFPTFFVTDDMAYRKLVAVEAAFIKDENGDDVEIGREEDADNKDQTVTFTDVPKTGDDHDIGLWAILAVVSALALLGMGVTVLRGKKRNEI